MIADVLNRRFVLDQLDAIKRDLEEASAGDDRRRGAETPREAEELERDDFAEALSRLQAAEAEERAYTSGQPGNEPPADDRRGEAAPDIDDVSFFSRDPILSNVQSALEEYVETREPGAIEEARSPADDDRRRGRDDAEEEEVPVVTDRRIRRSDRDVSRDRRIGEPFSITDIRWVSSLFAKGVRMFRKRHPFNPDPAPRLAIADRVRVIVVGDWGSGVPRAVRVSEQIRRALEDGRRERLEQHVVHLGDVYYSGWAKEYEKRFLPNWPVDLASSAEITSWSLNANHDMYSGGFGYYGTLLADPRFGRQARSSMFSLANSRWRIVGLDTGWEDGGLKDPQPKWVADEAAAAAAAGQKLMLLSHHQLFSAFEKAGTLLGERLSGVLNPSRVHSWLWGHEHREVVYGPHAGLQFSACLGNGGVPAYMTHREGDPYPPPVTYESRARIKKGLESWAYFGFAILDFEDDRFHLQLVDENGRVHHRQTVV